MRRALLVLLLCGCAGGDVGPVASSYIRSLPSPLNPSFPISVEAAREQLTVQKDDAIKIHLDRPLVICGGFMDVGFGPWLMKRTLAPHLDGQIICVNFATCGSFQGCRETLVRKVDRELGVVDPNETTEVDVIGQSMGGLIAVHAALEDPAMGKRVKIKRLFTICSPLQGAKLATKTSFNVFDYQKDLRPGSALYGRLLKTDLDYELISYARLDDQKVGEQYQSLPGHPMWWVNTPPSEDAHDGADCDPRILLDILKRLRGETPITTSPPVPLPAPAS